MDYNDSRYTRKQVDTNMKNDERPIYKIVDQAKKVDIDLVQTTKEEANNAATTKENHVGHPTLQISP